MQSYFEILEDTLLGFQLDAFRFSLRKRLKSAPKFFFFDLGVARALARQLNATITAQTSHYGELFETFVVNEIFRKNSYEKLQYKMSYLQTASGVEIDLVLDRPSKPLALIEIKSTNHVREDHVASLNKISQSFENADVFCFSKDEHPKQFGRVLCLPWWEGLKIL